jgi:methanogenic corrinoid protein MtbC1
MVVVWFTVLELIVNNVAEPLLYGHSTGVSGVGVIVAAIFWTWIWGPVGLVLAMPLTVCTVVMAKYIPSLQFLTVLLGDEVPMSPQERIYQRLLAGDVDEARDLAVERLKASSLLEVYDQMLIPALELAESDRHAGLLHEEQETAVAETARELVDELAEIADRERSAGAAAQHSIARPRVMCIPLRDDADEIAGAMLELLLEAEGFEVELAGAGSLTGELVELIAEQKIEIVAISILPPLPPRYSRLLCTRVRSRYPELPIVVGYWCESCAPELEHRLCAETGQTVTNLAAAVERVLAVSVRPQVAEKIG